MANYPFDGYPDRGTRERPGQRNPAPDDATFRHLAKLYARAHTFMARSEVGVRVEGGCLGWRGLAVSWLACGGMALTRSGPGLRRHLSLPLAPVALTFNIASPTLALPAPAPTAPASLAVVSPSGVP